MVRWEDYLCYFYCGIPQKICVSWDINADTGGLRQVVSRRCQFQGVIIESIISIWGRQLEEFRGQVKEQMVKDGFKDFKDIEFKDIVKWLGRKIRQGGLESIKIYKVFIEFLEFIDIQGI